MFLFKLYKKKEIATISSVMIYSEQRDIFHYDSILSTVALSFYISKMHTPATLHIFANDTLAQCLHHSIAKQYLENVQIFYKEKQENDQKQSFKFKEGKVFFCKEKNDVNSNHYNPENIRFEAKELEGNIAADLILIHKNDDDEEENIDMDNYYQISIDSNGDDEESDDDEEELKQIRVSPNDQLNNYNIFWDDVHIMSNTISRNTEVSIIEDFITTIFGIPYTLLSDSGYYIHRETYKITVPLNTDNIYIMRNFKKIVKDLKEKNQIDGTFLPKSTLLPIIYGDLDEIYLEYLFDIAILWYCQILPSVQHINTDGLPISFQNAGSYIKKPTRQIIIDKWRKQTGSDLEATIAAVADIGNKSGTQIKRDLRELGLDITGNKKELTSRLRNKYMTAKKAAEDASVTAKTITDSITKFTFSFDNGLIDLPIGNNDEEKINSLFIATFMNNYLFLPIEKESLFTLMQTGNRDSIITYILDTFFNIN